MDFASVVFEPGDFKRSYAAHHSVEFLGGARPVQAEFVFVEAFIIGSDGFVLRDALESFFLYLFEQPCFLERGGHVGCNDLPHDHMFFMKTFFS